MAFFGRMSRVSSDLGTISVDLGSNFVDLETISVDLGSNLVDLGSNLEPLRGRFLCFCDNPLHALTDSHVEDATLGKHEKTSDLPSFFRVSHIVALTRKLAESVETHYQNNYQASRV